MRIAERNNKYKHHLRLLCNVNLLLAHCL